MLRIAITQRVVSVPDGAERRDCLDQAWTALFADLGWIAVPVPNRTSDVTAFLSELRIDGVVLSGGNDVSEAPGAADVSIDRDFLETRLLDACHERDISVLGVCRGLQRIVVHYGGRLSRLAGHAGEAHSVEPGATRFPVPVRNEVNSFHDFGVWEVDLGGVLRAAVKAGDGSVEAVLHPGRRQWGILWHPERGMRDDRDVRLLQARFGVLPA